MRLWMIPILFSSVISGALAAESANLAMPRQLYELGVAQGCPQIENFYDSDAAQGSAHLYGVASGERPYSVAIWCKRPQSGGAVLMFAMARKSGFDYVGEIVFPYGSEGLVMRGDYRPPANARVKEIPDPNGIHPRDNRFEGRAIQLGASSESYEILFYQDRRWYLESAADW